MEDVKELAKFKAFGKDIHEGLLTSLTEKIDLTLLNDFRTDYVLKGSFDSKNMVYETKSDQMRDQLMVLKAELAKFKKDAKEKFKEFLKLE
jgi:hypothetical protein